VQVNDNKEKKSEERVPETLFRLEATVYGKVQGVSFRSFVAKEAMRYGITGVVENMGDRSLRVVAEGNRATLQSLLSRLNMGPKDAEVSRVETKWGPAQGKYSSFDIS
jgi:acylphosphatase